MNDTLDDTLDSNVRDKSNFFEEYEYDDLIDLLSSNDIKTKHFAVLALDKIKSKDDAKLLVSNLVGQDGKVREAVAFKINEFALNPKYTTLFINDKNFDIFFEGLLDINGNICRLIVALTKINEFNIYLADKLPKSITEILLRIEKLASNEKQYVVSKRNFQLYWCLEALFYVIDNVAIENVKDILFKTGVFQDYTIREKTAKILAKISDTRFNELKEKLKNDENYYVKRYLSDV